LSTPHPLSLTFSQKKLKKQGTGLIKTNFSYRYVNDLSKLFLKESGGGVKVLLPNFLRPSTNSELKNLDNTFILTKIKKKTSDFSLKNHLFLSVLRITTFFIFFS